MEKIRAVNDEYKTSNKDFSIGVSAMIHLDNLTSKLQNPEEMQQHDIIEAETNVLNHLMKWNDQNCFLVMDLIRMYCLHRDSAQLLNSFDFGVKFLIYCATCLKY